MSFLSSVTSLPFDTFYNHYLSTPCNSWIVGQSGSGKTTLLRDLLQNWSKVTSKISPIHRLVMCFSCWQPEYDQIIKSLKPQKVKLFKEFPAKTLADPDFWHLDDQNGQNLLLIDDLSDQCAKSPEFQQLHEVLGHHYKINIFVLLQDIYRPSPILRGSLHNCHYLFLLPSNSSSGGTLVNLQKLLFPAQGGLLTCAYRQCFNSDDSAKKQRYLLIDSTLNCPFKYRLRSGILPNEQGIILQPIDGQ